MKAMIVFILELYQSLVWATGRTPYEVTKMSSPHQSYKHRVIKHYARKYKCNAFIETGTYRGGTTQAVKKNFHEIHTIEVVKSLYEDNCKRFAKDKKIHLYCGDSKNMLGEMIDRVRNKKRILFFLDGHYSGGETGMGAVATPVEHEIETIYKKLPGKHFVILIDDARCFTGEAGYPVLKDFVGKLRLRENVDVSVKGDIIRVIV